MGGLDAVWAEVFGQLHIFTLNVERIFVWFFLWAIPCGAYGHLLVLRNFCTVQCLTNNSGASSCITKDTESPLLCKILPPAALVPLVLWERECHHQWGGCRRRKCFAPGSSWYCCSKKESEELLCARRCHTKEFCWARQWRNGQRELLALLYTFLYVSSLEAIEVYLLYLLPLVQKWQIKHNILLHTWVSIMPDT